MGLNDLITYSSPKFVVVRDWRLGALKYSFMLAVFAKVIVLDIFISCRHLKPHPALGIGFVDLIPPVCKEGDTDCHAKFSNIEDLKYCRRFAGKNPTVTKDAKVGDFVSAQQPCKYYDEDRLIWVPQEASSMFVPLKSVKQFQKINPDCYDGEAEDEGTAPGYDNFDRLAGTRGPPRYLENDVSKRLSQQKRREEAKVRRLAGKSMACTDGKYITTSKEEFYVADIGEFTLEFRHSFESKETGLFGTAAAFQGFFAACKSNHVKDVRKDCRRMKVPGSTGETVPEDVMNLEDPTDLVPSLGIGPKGGDAMQLKDLLKLTPAAQANEMKEDVLDVKLPDRLLLNGSSMRNRGGLLMVEVDYTNFVPMRPGIPVPKFMEFLSAPIKPVTYTYRPYLIPSNVLTRNQVIPSADGKTRTVEVWYGLQIRMDFAGKMVAFDITEMIAAMTTGLVLMTAATAFVDSVMTFLMPLKDKYKLLKYQVSEDFHDAKTLHAKAAEKKVELKSGFACSDLMLSKLSPQGTLKQGADMSKKELIYMLTTQDIRLNRLDGMCDKAEFSEGSEADPRWYAMGNFKRDFYSKTVGAESISAFSDTVDPVRRKKAPVTAAE